MDADGPPDPVDSSHGPPEPRADPLAEAPISCRGCCEDNREGGVCQNAGQSYLPGGPVGDASTAAMHCAASQPCGAAPGGSGSIGGGLATATEDGGVSEPPVDVSPSGDGRYFKVVTKPGVGDELPVSGDRVRVRALKPIQNSTFSAGAARGEVMEFTLNEYTEDVPRLLHLAVSSMRLGEACRVSSPVRSRGAAHNTNDTGRAQRLSKPGRGTSAARVEYEIELLSWEGQDLSDDKNCGILKSTLCNGTGCLTPTVGSTVEAELLGKFNGRTFEHRVVTFTCGNGSAEGVIDGVDIAVAHLVVGERARLKIKAEYAFGRDGQSAFGVPPDAAVTYEVTLMGFDVVKEPWEFSDISERLSQSKACKEMGNCLYREGKLRPALRWYDRAARLSDAQLARPGDLRASHPSELARDARQAPMSPTCNDSGCSGGSAGNYAELEGEQRELFVAATLNKSICHLKLARFGEAKDLCDSVLAIDGANLKALMRRLEASKGLEDWESAKRDCLRILEVDPQNRSVKAQLTTVSGKLKMDRDKQKEVYARMLSKPPGSHGQGIRRPEDKTVFDEPIGEWSNDMAAGIMTLQQELQAFDEAMPEDVEDLSGNEDNPSEPQG